MPHFYDLVTYVSPQLLSWSIGALVGSAAVLLVSFLLWRVCENRLSPRLGFWLFFLVLLKPFVPIDLSLPGYLDVWTPSGITQQLLFAADSVPEIRRGNLEQSIYSDNAPIRTSASRSQGHVETQALANASRNVESAVNSKVKVDPAPGLPPPIPYPAELETDGQRANWFQNWQSTPAALPWLASSAAYSEQRNAQVRYMCGVENDGTFAIHDLPSGSYTFEYELDFPGKSFGPLQGRLEFPFTIESDDQPRTTVDLGELQVQPPN